MTSSKSARMYAATIHFDDDDKLAEAKICINTLQGVVDCDKGKPRDTRVFSSIHAQIEIGADGRIHVQMAFGLTQPTTRKKAQGMFVCRCSPAGSFRAAR